MTSMTAVRLHHFGGPERLRVETVDRPEPAAGELLVRLAATGVNPVDYKTREGKFPPIGEDKLPMILGRDASGSVEQAGAGVDGFAAGDAVFAMPGFDRGTYAEFAILKVDECARIPDGFDPVEAGAVPLAALTAWQGLFDHGKLARGQRVLIHGGAGGVGHFAVQFAASRGAEVMATCKGADRSFVEGLGANQAIDYETQRFEDIAKNVDLVFDLIGGETQDRSWQVLRRGGRIISTVQEPDADKAKAAGASDSRRYMAQPSGADLTAIAALLASGEVAVSIAERFALADVAAAQARLEKGGIRGKIAVTIG